MVKFCEHYLRRFSVLRVLLCPTVIDRGCQVILGFGRHLGMTDAVGLDLMLVSTDDDRQDEFIVIVIVIVIVRVRVRVRV